MPEKMIVGSGGLLFSFRQVIINDNKSKINSERKSLFIIKVYIVSSILRTIQPFQMAYHKGKETALSLDEGAV